MSSRPCTRISCQAPAALTLTYAYADSMAVLGPLSDRREPHGYDLCAAHAERLRVPQGWSVVRIAMPPAEPEPAPGPDAVPPAPARARRAAPTRRPLRRV